MWNQGNIFIFSRSCFER